MTEERIELNSGNIVDESLLREGGEANRNIKFVWMGRGGQWEEEVINWPWSTRKAGVGERGKERQAKTSVRWTWLPPSQVRHFFFYLMAISPGKGGGKQTVVRLGQSIFCLHVIGC